MTVLPLNHDAEVIGLVRIEALEAISRSGFARCVELIRILAENLCYHAEDHAHPESTVPSEAGTPLRVPAPRRCRHVQIRRAMAFIEAHLCDGGLTMGHVAKELRINRCYLAHLFVQEVGIRMSRYLALRRTELAKALLLTTDWQIKRVAFESGHHSADWFSTVFHTHTGFTPTEFRRLPVPANADSAEVG